MWVYSTDARMNHYLHISMTHHIKKLQNKNYMNIPIETDKNFDKIQHLV